MFEYVKQCDVEGTVIHIIPLVCTLVKQRHVVFFCSINTAKEMYTAASGTRTVNMWSANSLCGK